MFTTDNNELLFMNTNYVCSYLFFFSSSSCSFSNNICLLFSMSASYLVDMTPLHCNHLLTSLSLLSLLPLAKQRLPLVAVNRKKIQNLFLSHQTKYHQYLPTILFQVLPKPVCVWTGYHMTGHMTHITCSRLSNPLIRVNILSSSKILS